MTNDTSVEAIVARARADLAEMAGGASAGGGDKGVDRERELAERFADVEEEAAGALG